MTQRTRPQKTPRKILLATDLGARCDRALDRAVALATGWQAELAAVHAVEDTAVRLRDQTDRDLPSWRRGPEPLEIATSNLLRDLGASTLPIAAIIEEGEPAEVILRTAETSGCDLIVTAVARDEVLGRFSLGATVDKVLRNASVPVLVVRQRPRRPYSSLVVAADTSKASHAALLKAVDFFPDCGLRVFHAYQPPLAGLLADQADYRKGYGKMVADEFNAFLKETNVNAQRLLDVRVEDGDPAQLIPQYVAAFHANLVVLGTEGRSALLELLIGSTAKSVLAGLECDALIVPAAAASRVSASETTM